MTDLKERILTRVKPDLERIEAALMDNLTPHVELVKTIAGHILFSGGKRLRPLLMVLSARLCGFQGDFAPKFSTIFEYLHAATLLHDDLVDGARLRRGNPAAHTVWDNSVAVLTGDFLLARALAIAAEADKPEIIATIAWVTENMAQGEIAQLSRKADLGLTEADYLEVIRCKTAVLFQGACMISAQLADADQALESALSDYGYHLGLAFQMADDLLDYTADTGTLGKAVGADLREGKLTLPVIYTLKKADAEDREKIESIVTNPEFTDNEFAYLVKMMEHYDGIGYTHRQAGTHVEQAVSALDVFDMSDTRDILEDIARFALVRGA